MSLQLFIDIIMSAPAVFAMLFGLALLLFALTALAIIRPAGFDERCNDETEPRG